MLYFTNLMVVIYVMGSEQDKLLAWKAFYSNINFELWKLRSKKIRPDPKYTFFFKDGCLNFAHKNIDMDGCPSCLYNSSPVSWKFLWNIGFSVVVSE